jgi:phosphopantothenoylcysteine decarboxylase/phosphopantothenate--cysteine ligase
LSFASLSGEKVYSELFSLTDESEMGHIRLSRAADLIVIAPASADLLAKMAAGLANDLASTVLLASDKPVLAAPAMNERMWANPATQRNLAKLTGDGLILVGPEAGDLACGEEGLGRMAEPDAILAAIESHFSAPLAGLRALVTSGPTIEAIDPVRYITNRSSGKQGHAIAAACARLGAEVTLVSGPTSQPDPAGVRVVHIESAAEMHAACEKALPVDVAVCAAAVADWRVARPRGHKVKKDGAPPKLELVENADILAALSAAGNRRPTLVVGFAAETEKVVKNAVAKRARKGCDWIVANDVSPRAGTLGGDRNAVHLITADGVESWPEMSKAAVAERLAARVAEHLAAARDA